MAGRYGVPRVRPWIAAACVAALVLAGYFGYLGYRYYQASRASSEAQAQIEEVARDVRRGAIDTTGPETELRKASTRLEELVAAFGHPVTDDLLRVVTDASKQAGVGLATVTIGERRQQSAENEALTTQAMALTAKGNVEQIKEFLSFIRERLPVAQVASASLSMDSDPPTVQIQILFYLLPEPENEGAA